MGAESAHWAITGITSGAGRRLAEMLLERGATVSGLVRDPERADARALAQAGVRLVQGDLAGKGALQQLCNESEIVCHAAAHVGDWGPVEQFVQVNVEGTRNVLSAAADAGVRRFVHLSSTAVYGRPERGHVNEHWPTLHSGLPYEDTKTDAERLAFELGEERGLDVVAVRPPIIYGPYDRNFLPRAMEGLRTGKVVLINGGTAAINVVWVDHLVDVLIRAAGHEDAAGEAFNVGDVVGQRPPTVRDVFETIADAIGAPRPKKKLPFAVAYPLSWAVHRAFQVAKSDKPPPLTPFVVKILTRDVIYDATKAHDVLGFEPQVSPLDGIARWARYHAQESS